ncbi:hypothetical protein HK097_007476 [Rhizophlyctis rosea]|uniref:Ras-GEF domain-containing protein n=1 Tax=Rhizophlyctis rosea TaxID=64517 RepID=A0AAD5X816_9FUNG|nr:hypothetical protein HK097_007476 [Rhizophlyctis rosea]
MVRAIESYPTPTPPKPSVTTSTAPRPNASTSIAPRPNASTSTAPRPSVRTAEPRHSLHLSSIDLKHLDFEEKGSLGGFSTPRKTKIVERTQHFDIPESPLLRQYQYLSGSIPRASIAGSESILLGSHHTDASWLMGTSPETNHSLEVEEEIGAKQLAYRILHNIHIAAGPAASICAFRPLIVAYQLCRIEQELFCGFKPEDLLSHQPPKHPHPDVQRLTEFFNYLAIVVESSILGPEDPNARALAIRQWVKIAAQLLSLRNFQSLKAVLGALNTPPIVRLKKTWPFLPKKTATSYQNMSDLMTESSNFAAYREHLRSVILRPTIPYLGTFTHDLTFLTAAVKGEGRDPIDDHRIQDMLKQIRYFQEGPKYQFTHLYMALEQSGEGSSLPFQKPRHLGLSATAPPELQTLKELDTEEMADFVAHWILSRPMYTEKELDKLSLLREPRPSSVVQTSDSSPTGAQAVLPNRSGAVQQPETMDPLSSGKEYLISYNVPLHMDMEINPQNLVELAALSPGPTRKRASGGALMDALKASFTPKKTEKRKRQRSKGQGGQSDSDSTPTSRGSSQWSMGSGDSGGDTPPKRHSITEVIRDLISFGSEPGSPTGESVLDKGKGKQNGVQLGASDAEGRERDVEKAKSPWLKRKEWLRRSAPPASTTPESTVSANGVAPATVAALASKNGARNSIAAPHVPVKPPSINIVSPSTVGTPTPAPILPVTASPTSVSGRTTSPTHINSTQNQPRAPSPAVAALAAAFNSQAPPLRPSRSPSAVTSTPAHQTPPPSAVPLTPSRTGSPVHTGPSNTVFQNTNAPARPPSRTGTPTPFAQIQHQPAGNAPPPSHSGAPTPFTQMQQQPVGSTLQGKTKPPPALPPKPLSIQRQNVGGAGPGSAGVGK